MSPDDRWNNLVERVNAFTRERNWQQFHDVKNLAMAVASEAGEILAELRWLRSDEVSQDVLPADIHERVSLEMADVMIFLIRLADVAGVDLLDAAERKLRLNAQRFPAGS